MRTPMGPNVCRLLIEFVALESIPPGSKNPLADGIEAIKEMVKPGNRIITAAKKNVDMALAAVKASPDNQWGDDEEAIAGEILRRVEASRAMRKRRPPL